MIDTAGTICNAAETAIDNGAKSVMAVATHPVLSGPSINRLRKSVFSKIVVCNTIEINKNKKIKKMNIINVANVFGEAIKRIVDGTSLSSMFKNY
jgi:ribose-phosphate pyrophosphokinase